jgi:ATP-binding cassette, subfamily B (MDR/TAP), member 1
VDDGGEPGAIAGNNDYRAAVGEEGDLRGIAFHRYFKYNSRTDNVMLLIGTAGAIIAGLFVPTIALIMGEIAQKFGGKVDPAALAETVAAVSWLVAGVSMIIFVFAYIFFAFWQHVAENISLRLRKIYLKSLLNQEIGYFEHMAIEQIPAQMAEIFETVQSSVGEKYATLIFAVSTAVGGCLVAFFTGRTYALVLVGYLPVFFVILGTFGVMVARITAARLEVIKQMGGLVSETLYAVKVVASFGREREEINKFLGWT